jgi:integrase
MAFSSGHLPTSPVEAEIPRFLVHRAVFSTGERFSVVLHAETLQPAVLATRYLVDERREVRQASTIERDARVLCWLYEWCGQVGIDLETALREGDVLAPGSLRGFARWLRARRTEKVVGAVGVAKDEGASRVPVLPPRTLNDYLAVVAGFFVWAVEEFAPRAYPEGVVRERVEQAKRRVERAFRAFRAASGVERAKRYGLTAEEVADLRDIVAPGGGRNPFRKALQFRNHLIVETLLATGLRRGELLKLRVPDLPQGPKQTLTVLRQPDDPADPRREEPRVKTRSRELPLPRRLAVDLHRYVQGDRGACPHRYLFVSSRGAAPLTASGLGRVFARLRGSFPGGARPLHPHLLRHTFNDQVMERARSMGMPDDVRVKVQNYLNGWVEGSTQGEVYTRRYVEAEALRVVEGFQSSLW